MTHEQSAFWLAGFMDGEGCVGYYPETGARCVTISNTDPELIAIASEALDTLDITHSIRVRERRQPHYKEEILVTICGKENLDMFYRWVPFQHPAKVLKLRAALDSYQR